MKYLKIALLANLIVIQLQSSSADTGWAPCDRQVDLRSTIESQLGKACADWTPADLAEVRQLSFKMNSDQVISSRDFESLPNLSRLEIENIPNTEMIGVLDSLTRLTTLKLSFRHQAVAFRDAFGERLMFPKQSDLKVLELHKLNFDVKPIGPIESSHYPLYDEDVANLSKLEKLTISHSNISYLSFHVLEQLPKLRQLSLPYNKIDWFLDNVLDSSTSLELLDLSHNPLRESQSLSFSKQLAEPVVVKLCGIEQRVVSNIRRNSRPKDLIVFDTSCPNSKH